MSATDDSAFTAHLDTMSGSIAFIVRMSRVLGALQEPRWGQATVMRFAGSTWSKKPSEERKGEAEREGALRKGGMELA